MSTPGVGRGLLRPQRDALTTQIEFEREGHEYHRDRPTWKMWIYIYIYMAGALCHTTRAWLAERAVMFRVHASKYQRKRKSKRQRRILRFTGFGGLVFVELVGSSFPGVQSNIHRATWKHKVEWHIYEVSVRAPPPIITIERCENISGSWFRSTDI